VIGIVEEFLLKESINKEEDLSVKEENTKYEIKL
jgi:hypothetical protein